MFYLQKTLELMVKHYYMIFSSFLILPLNFPPVYVVSVQRFRHFSFLVGKSFSNRNHLKK